MNRLTNIELKRAIRDKFAWPGGYEIFGICSDGGVLCCDCMKQEYRQIADARKYGGNNGWRVVAVDHAGNTDTHTACDHCSKEIVDGFGND